MTEELVVPDGGWGWVVALGAALVQMQVGGQCWFRSNNSDAVCNPGHNFWGLFRPPDHPGRGGGGAVALRPRLLRALHHGLHHVLLLPHLHRPLQGVQLSNHFLEKLLPTAFRVSLFTAFSTKLKI